MPSKPYAIGIDVGGTKIAAGLVSRAGTIEHRLSTRGHAEQDPETVIAAIEQAYQDLLSQSGVNPADVEAVGLGFAGNTNGPAGVVLVSSNLPAWNNFPLRDALARKLGVQVVLDNDANVCAVGEHRYGAGRGCSDMAYITFSTGLGIGIIINNQIYAGHTGTAGELGHVVIELGGALCPCGKRGCVMAYGSGIGISRMVYERVEAGAETSLGELVRGETQRIAVEAVADAATQGDEVAGDIIRTAGRYCGVALSMIVQILNPEVIVVGGGLTRVGPMLMDPALEAMRANTQPELWDSVRVVPWQLGDDLGVIGAAAKAFADAEALST